MKEGEAYACIKENKLKRDDVMKIVTAISYRYEIIAYSIYSTNIIL